MIEGLYAAASGMIAIEGRQSVVANNIANAATPGFRRQNPVQKGFYEVLKNKMRHPFWFNTEEGPGGGLRMVETFTDLNGGAVTTTGDSLNVALSGQGYLVVDTPQGERFTRNGKLAVDSQGVLKTADGLAIQGEGSGNINVGTGKMTIDSEGTVLSDGVTVGKLRLIEFEDPHMLSRVGHNLYSASPEAMRRSAASVDTRVHHNSLEMANVQLPYEMAQLMLGTRAYAANQRVITAIDETASRLIERVGSPV